MVKQIITVIYFLFPANRWSPRRYNTQLEDALKLVRGSPSGSRSGSARVRSQTSPTSSYYRQNTDPLGKPYFNKYAHPTINGQTPQEKREELHNKSLRNLASSRNLFEQQLETYQQTLLEQQQQTLKDFNQQIMKEIEDNPNAVNTNQNGTNGLERSESLSSLDSLEEGSNDTLRESCDLDKFMDQKQGGDLNNGAQVTRNVSFVDSDRDSVRTAVHANVMPASTNNHTPQNIDSYNVHAQILAKKQEDQKQQFYLQRQREIQQQLQEQKFQQQYQEQMLQQQKDQQELQQKILDQQRKQQLVLQQHYEKQQQEQLEKQKQQLQQQLLEQQQSALPPSLAQANTENGKENFRPKAQMKAWATPSPHPPSPATVAMTTAPSHVTHASPYGGKNTSTNMTVPTYEKPPVSNGSNTANMKPSLTNSASTVSNTNINGNVLQNRTDENVKYSEYTNSVVSAQDKNLSFLEAVTNDLASKQQPLTETAVTNSAVSSAASAPMKVPPSTSTITPKTVQSTATSSVATPVKVTTASTTVTAGKPPVAPSYYISSYGEAYAAKQQVQRAANGASVRQGTDPPSTTALANTMKMTGGMPAPWGTPNGNVDSQTVMLTPNTALNGDDAGDTDSVSTICEEKETETKGTLYTLALSHR